MVRLHWVLVVVSLVGMSAGCRMCAHCDDYSGPVLDGTCCGTECGGRAGSILSHGPAGPVGPMVSGGPIMEQPVAEPNVQPQSAANQMRQRATPTPAQSTDSAKAAQEFGIDPRMIISVSDRKLGEGEGAAPTEAPPVGTL